MSVQIRQRLPTIGYVVQRIEGARLRTLRSEFNSLHPFHLYEGSATPSACSGGCALVNCSRCLGARIGSPSFVLAWSNASRRFGPNEEIRVGLPARVPFI